MRRIFGTTYYRRKIVECNASNQDFMLETLEIFINFPELLSLNMRIAKYFFTFVITLQIKRKESIQSQQLGKDLDKETLSRIDGRQRG